MKRTWGCLDDCFGRPCCFAEHQAVITSNTQLGCQEVKQLLCKAHCMIWDEGLDC